MRRINRNNLIKRSALILGSNEGASMVLVIILAIIVLTAVVVLRVTTGTFMASSNRQLNQDQAYELAASLGESIEVLVSAGKYDIYSVSDNTTIYTQDSGFTNLPDASVTAVVTDTEDGKGKVLTVVSHVGDASYEYTREYR